MEDILIIGPHTPNKVRNDISIDDSLRLLAMLVKVRERQSDSQFYG